MYVRCAINSESIMIIKKKISKIYCFCYDLLLSGFEKDFHIKSLSRNGD